MVFIFMYRHSLQAQVSVGPAMKVLSGLRVGVGGHARFGDDNEAVGRTVAATIFGAADFVGVVANGFDALGVSDDQASGNCRRCARWLAGKSMGVTGRARVAWGVRFAGIPTGRGFDRGQEDLAFGRYFIDYVDFTATNDAGEGCGGGTVDGRRHRRRAGFR